MGILFINSHGLKLLSGMSKIRVKSLTIFGFYCLLKFFGFFGREGMRMCSKVKGGLLLSVILESQMLWEFLSIENALIDIYGKCGSINEVHELFD